MCIARTLLTRPEVLLMDEPTSSLDPANRRGIEALARELADAGLGVLWVTHDLAQAGRLADDVVVLVDGRNADGRRGGALPGGPDGPTTSPRRATMSSTHIGWAGLAASLVLVAVAVGLSGWQRLHLVPLDPVGLRPGRRAALPRRLGAEAGARPRRPGGVGVAVGGGDGGVLAASPSATGRREVPGILAARHARHAHGRGRSASR